MQSPAVRLPKLPSACDFLLAVGLDYLSLDRSAATLSGGEAQRIRLATQIGSQLRGVLYVLDEPSIGLHPRDNDRLLGSLEQSARPGQHRAGGRARRRDHPPRRLRGRPRSRRGPRRRRAGGHRHARARSPPTPPRSPAATSPAQLPFAVPAAAPRAQRQGAHRCSARREHNLKEPRRRIPARRAHRGHRRLRLRQIHAGQRHPLPRAGPDASTARTEQPGAHSAPSKASSTSTRSSKSTSRPSAARRAPIPPPTPASSRPSAISSPCCPNRASAATSPAASASTSKAAAAKPARATACGASK